MGIPLAKSCLRSMVKLLYLNEDLLKVMLINH